MNEQPQDHVQREWTDEELDTALAALRVDVFTDDEVLARARGQLLIAAATTSLPAPTGPGTVDAPSPPKRRTGRWLAAAAAVGVLVAGVLLAPTLQLGGDSPRASAEAATLLNKAASLTIGAKDPAVSPGQYRYVVTHSWYEASGASDGSGFSFLFETVREVWIPADPRQLWLQRETTGNYRWLQGDEAAAKAAGILPSPDVQELRARCGDFHLSTPGLTVNGKSGAQAPCDGSDPSWQDPTPEFLAGLPRDPQKLYDRLRRDTAGRGSSPDAEMLVYVADVLRGGLVPGDLRAALYKVLARLPGLQVTERSANLDGREGTALGIRESGSRRDIIIDAASGEFIGEREVRSDGQVIASTSVTTAVVAKMGVKPAG